MENPLNIPPHRLLKKTERLKEDAELEFKIQGLNLQILNADPILKTIQISGNYGDFLLARKIAEKKGWVLEN